MLKGFLEATVRDAVTYTEHSRRKTVRADAKNHERIPKYKARTKKARRTARAHTHAHTHTHTRHGSELLQRFDQQ